MLSVFAIVVCCKLLEYGQTLLKFLLQIMKFLDLDCLIQKKLNSILKEI